MSLNQTPRNPNTLNINGHPVTLHFCENPSPDTFRRVKEILLSACQITTERDGENLDNP